MRILQLGKFYPIRGGVEKVMWDLTRGLAGRGVACDMLCAKLPQDGIDLEDRPYLGLEDGVEILRFPDGRTVYCVKALAKKAATMLSPAMVRWLRRHRQDYDIVHIHHPDPMAALALRLSGFRGKVVLHWHSDILSQRFLLALYKPLQQWLIRRADVIVGTTPPYLEASPYLRDVQDKCMAVPIGIDPVRFDPEKAEAFRAQFPGKWIILSVGRLVPYKGFRYLIDALGRLPDNYQLVIGGTGPLQEGLEAQIRENGLIGRVSMIGYVPSEDLPSWFGACDLFVLSSVMKTEAFGIVQIEAMSCGKPVVATRIPESGVSWVNKDGVSGLNVPPENAAALADAIQKVADGRDRYGAGARRLFEERYGFDRMIDRIKAVYEGLLA
jgi:rhamnosyl/mannosyltransferase